MKKHFTLIFTLFLILLQISASAQGEWKWANYWTGNDDLLNPSHAYNYVVRTAFDDDGNVYVFGSFGGNAFLYDQNQEIRFSDIPIIESNSSPGNVLAKFNAQGDLLWYKFIKSTNGDCLPYDMVIKDSVILIAGEYSWTYALNKPFWFFDTLITEQTALSYGNGAYQPPFTFGNYSYFVYFDPNGDIIQKHFVQTKSRECYGNTHAIAPLGSRFIGGYPICIDNDNNIYIAVSMQYEGNESDPYGIIIDCDTANMYNIYLPGNYCGLSLNNIMLYKFAPDWSLVWGKPLVHHTEGLSPAIPTDTVNPSFRPFVGGMSIDNQGNLYISGYLMDMFLTDQYNQYPMYIYWDNVHRAIIDDHGLAFCLPFIVKYDSAGTVQWSNQAFMKHAPTATWYNKIYWTDNCVTGNSVYLLGDTRVTEGYSTLYYFDNENNNMDISQSSCYFARFNRDNGSFENSGVFPGEKTCSGETAKPAVVNNHLLCLSKDFFNRYFILGQFNTNGTFKKGDTIVNNSGTMSANQGIVLNETGYLLNSFISTQDLTFGHDLTLNFDDHQHSHAVVALRYDPSILEPYPEDSTGIADRESLSRAVVRAYPNPATDKVTVEVMMPLEDGEIYLGDVTSNFTMERVTVTDLAGKVVLQRAVSGTRAELDFSALPAGTYIITASGEMGEWEGKVVKK
ncbi:MAG: T9SS type A sorting domain-containing protein [Bacteroidales bacterium]|nr:T9SS type A sorting domain-containing protein [Bacteroidales bacterium]